MTPTTPSQLHAFIQSELGISIPREPLAPGSAAPFDYILHTYFEGRVPPTHPGDPPGPRAPADCVVWANRGGGKTFLGAVATALDLRFKKDCQVRIIAGSLEQAGHMHHHLRTIFERPAFKELLLGKPTDKRILLKTGASAEVLAQSQSAVRGTRVQKIRCDELELFDPELWSAAQLATRSIQSQPRAPWGPWVRGSVECLSTMHRPMGLMHRVAADAIPIADVRNASAPRRGRVLFRWSVLDSLEHCPPERDCAACGLFPECAGRAKNRPTESAGHLTIDDALLAKGRVSTAVWESEMLCLRPLRDSNVYPEFDPARHVIDADTLPEGGNWLAGMDFGFRNPSVILWAHHTDDGVLRIMHERLAGGLALDRHIAALIDGSSPRPAWIAIDPAGRQVNDQSGQSNCDLLRKAGLSVRATQAGISPGISLVRARLSPANGDAPRLFIHRRCEHLIDALTRYHYPVDRLDALLPVKDGPDHAADALRYLVATLDRPVGSKSGRYS